VIGWHAFRNTLVALVTVARACRWATCSRGAVYVETVFRVGRGIGFMMVNAILHPRLPARGREGVLLVAATYVVIKPGHRSLLRGGGSPRAPMSTDAGPRRARDRGGAAPRGEGAGAGGAAGALIVAAVAMVAALAPALPLADPNRTQPSGPPGPAAQPRITLSARTNLGP